MRKVQAGSLVGKLVDRLANTTIFKTKLGAHIQVLFDVGAAVKYRRFPLPVD